MEYIWKIRKLRTINEDNIANIVTQIHWSKVGTDDDGYSGECAGIIDLLKPAIADTFIPYELLSEEIVISWAKDHLVNHDFELYASAEIAREIMRKRLRKRYIPVDKALPWVEDVIDNTVIDNTVASDVTQS